MISSNITFSGMFTKGEEKKCMYKNYTGMDIRESNKSTISKHAIKNNILASKMRVLECILSHSRMNNLEILQNEGSEIYSPQFQQQRKSCWRQRHISHPSAVHSKTLIPK